MSIPGSCITVRAGWMRTECRHIPWAAVTICMVSERGWVIFSGWTGVGMNFGGGTRTFRPDAVAAHTVFAVDWWLAGGLARPATWPLPEWIMLGNTIPTASTVVTAARRGGPARVAGCRGTSSPPGIR